MLVGWYALVVLGLLLPGGLARLARTASSLVRVWDRIQPVFGGFGHNESPQPAGIPWFWLGMMAVGLGAAVMLWWQVLSGPSGTLHVYFFDVGQGDSVLIVTPQGRQVLVDGGPSSEGAVEALGGELAFWYKSLDLVVLTHLDADHSRGLMEVLERYRVKGVLVGSDGVDAPLRPQWEAALKRSGLEPVTVETGYRIDLEPGSSPGVVLEVLNPQREQARPPRSDLNDNAVVLRLVYGETSFLLASDVEAKAEAAMSRDGTTLDSDVLKVAHHGSKTSTTDDFLERVDSEIVVISVGSRNSYGHPDPGVLARLREMVGQANIYRTDKHGSIEVVSDGANIWVKTGGG